jgi:hypothetical protein
MKFALKHKDPTRWSLLFLFGGLCKTTFHGLPFCVTCPTPDPLSGNYLHKLSSSTYSFWAAPHEIEAELSNWELSQRFAFRADRDQKQRAFQYAMAQHPN